MMGIAESILPEFDHETATTRMLLERVPQDKAEWKPHERSRALGPLAMHIANILKWGLITLERTEFDTNPPDGSRVEIPQFQSTSGLLASYDANVASARSLLARTTDAEFMVQWTLKSGGRTLFSMPRVAVYRSLVLNHAVHHRGQLSVYLRLLEVPIPNLYGPTADTQS
jgi:uncharacterized damage-inducible protein DinB